MDEFTRQKFEIVVRVPKLVTALYMEFSKDFFYAGERHDFWELVYIDKGEMIVTAGEKQFTLKGGELTFHPPGEYHNLTSNRAVAPNVSILTFECASRLMEDFRNKIVALTPELKRRLAEIMKEGLSAFDRAQSAPPIFGMNRRPDAPFGGEQMTRNLLEVFLIELYRSGRTVAKSSRYSLPLLGKNVPVGVAPVLSFLSAHIGEKLTAADVARGVSMSEAALKKHFARFRPGGVMKLFGELKIERAKELIREEAGNFTEIADALGYEDVHYFSKCFKKVSGMTPSEYKNSIAM